MRTALTLAALAVLLALPLAAEAADTPAGTAVSVDPQASSQIGTSPLVPIATGDSVFMGQQIVTGSSGQVQVMFSDGTHLVVGPGSSLLIADYLLRGGGDTASKFVVDALAGSFRFVTGNSPKSAYGIQTPTGTIGVRGTAFDLTVDATTHQTSLLLYHGGVSMCSSTGACISIGSQCEVGTIPQNGAAAIDKHEVSARQFRYAASQASLLAAFRVPGAEGCIGKVSSTRGGTASPVTTPSDIGGGHQDNGGGNGGNNNGKGGGSGK